MFEDAHWSVIIIAETLWGETIEGGRKEGEGRGKEGEKRGEGGRKGEIRKRKWAQVNSIYNFMSST